jgi:hypothetical protein
MPGSESKMKAAPRREVTRARDQMTTAEPLRIFVE